jgi:hypothetical protein
MIARLVVLLCGTYGVLCAGGNLRGTVGDATAFGRKQGQDHPLVDEQLELHDPDAPAVQGNISSGGSLDEVLRVMRYWKPIGEPLSTRGPVSLLPGDKGTRYLTFEPDFGGFNNIRLQFEIIAILAHLTGRVLVLPKPQAFYLLHMSGRRGMSDYFEVEDLAKAMPVITTEQFLEAVKADVVAKLTPEAQSQLAAACPLNDWNCPNAGMRAAAEQLPGLVQIPKWNALDGTLVVGGLAAASARKEAPRWPPPGQQGRHTYEYTAELAASKVLHFQMQHPEWRMFGHEEQFFYFANAAAHTYYHRFMREHVHLRDDIARIAAGLVVRLLAAHCPGGDGGFNAVHVRRGDLQVPVQPADALVPLVLTSMCSCSSRRCSLPRRPSSRT